MKKIIKYLVPILLIIVVFNLNPLRTLCDWLVDTYHYKFANSSADFYIRATSAENFKGIEESWHEYLKKGNVKSNDTTLYRLFPMNPFAFWRYYNYFNPIYKLPYKNMEEIPKLKKSYRRDD